MKSKSFLVKLLAFFLFKSKGGVLNNFSSLISPREYKFRRDLDSESRVNRLIELIAPLPIVSELTRIGSVNDGGYFLPEHDLTNIEHLISGGIERNNEFEIEIANLGISGIQVDNSIERPPKIHKNLEFVNATIGDIGSGTFSIDKYLNSLNNYNVLVKLDIEGFERVAVAEISENQFLKIRTLVLELHDLDLVMDNEFWKSLEEMLLTIIGAGLVPCFVNPNNVTSSVILGGKSLPRNLEVTFTRREYVKQDFSIFDFHYLKKLQTKNNIMYSSLNIDHILLHHSTLI